jgi:metallo-beta-lactamase class B
MTKYRILSWFLVIPLFICCNNSKQNPETEKKVLEKEIIIDNSSLEYSSNDLIITKISAHVYQHISYLDTQSFGRVGCNGMLVVNNQEVVVFDTPTNNKNSQELINYLTKNKLAIKAIVATHFHSDCLGGLEVFHAANIPSYALDKTIELANKNKSVVPQNGFENELELTVGKEKVLAANFGEGHTVDNVIGYYPEEHVLFGGCLVKAVGAGKGNLEDANTNDWSKTVQRVKTAYPENTIVIPGHGKPGGTELLDFTIQLFE